MRNPWILLFAALVLLPADLVAQRGGRGRQGKNNGTTSRPQKPTGDLAASSIKAKWKDAETLEITATVKNASKEPYSGSRTVKLIVTGKDKKSETVVPIAMNCGEYTMSFRPSDRVSPGSRVDKMTTGGP